MATLSAMATTRVPLSTMRRWTRIEYERLVELGVFQPGERLELLDGQLVVREPQGTKHSAAIRRVVAALRVSLGDTWQIDSQLPIALDDDSEPEPDLSVVSYHPGVYRDAHPSHPVLIVEIAKTSYRIDRRYKASLYARAGVPEFWIVDLPHERVELHRAPEPSIAALYGWHYARADTLRASAIVGPLIESARPIPVADLLP